MKPLKVLVISGDFPPALSGVGDYSNRLCAHLAADGAAVTLLTTASESLPEDAGRPYRVLRQMKSWDMSQRAEMVSIARDFDIVSLQYPSALYGRGLGINMLPLSLMRLGVPCVVTIHDFRVMRKRWRARTIPMLSFARALIHVDQLDGEHLRRWSFRHAPMRHIPIASNAPVVDCDASKRAAWREHLGIQPDELLVAYFGILYPHKGVPEMLDAVATLRREGHRIRALCVGDFDREADYVAPMTARLQADHVTWVRGASLERVSECLHAADMAALPFYSGAGFNRSSLLSCLQHGLPTVTTDGPNTPANLKDVFELLLVPPQNSPAVTEALRKLATDASLRSRLRESAIAATANLSWPAVSRRHMEYFSQLAARPAQREVVHENPQRA
ncbi:MAG TPA: glycosyltransferase family 4 protein [Tepidisphaeraceae bacterium]|nr:glycosyltransferase family 4 protein [Tepidisphaeraceae bacterium]